MNEMNFRVMGTVEVEKGGRNLRSDWEIERARTDGVLLNPTCEMWSGPGLVIKHWKYEDLEAYTVEQLMSFRPVNWYDMPYDMISAIEYRWKNLLESYGETYKKVEEVEEVS